MSTLHIGTTDPEQIKELLPADLSIHEDGDRWEEWGEPHQEGDPHHLVIRGGDTVRYLQDLAWLMDQGASLEPMRFPDFQRGVVASITADDDWSEEFYHLRSKQPDPKDQE